MVGGVSGFLGFLFTYRGENAGGSGTGVPNVGCKLFLFFFAFLETFCECVFNLRKKILAKL